jgi:hypothetical protein
MPFDKVIAQSPLLSSVKMGALPKIAAISCAETNEHVPVPPGINPEGITTGGIDGKPPPDGMFIGGIDGKLSDGILIGGMDGTLIGGTVRPGAAVWPGPIFTHAARTSAVRRSETTRMAREL